MKFITPRRLAILGVILTLPMLYVTFFGGPQEEPEWPHYAPAVAEEIPLSEAWQSLLDDRAGRRAAVIGDRLFIETIELPGEAVAPESATEAASAESAGEAHLPLARVEVTKLPYPAAGLISRMAEEAKIDLQIYENQTLGNSWTDRMIQIVPALFIILMLLFVFGRGAGKSLGLTSAYEIIDQDKLTETFDDVAGIDAAREEIQEIVDFLKDPKAASRLGGRMPKGALFDGPPGAGKTLLARAMAKEAGVPFMTIEASGVNQLFVGAGAMKIRKAFREARKIAPCIIFIDEIDAMGRARGSSSSGAGDEKETTLNAVLTELDGFDAREGIVVIAATNRPEILDPALTRRGRIDRKITISLPDLAARKEILAVHCRKIKAMPDLDITAIASTTFGFSGADLAALVNEAALLATRNNSEMVTLPDFEGARDRMIVGLSGSKREIAAEDKYLTAVHEAGHALVAAMSPDADPIEKATIVPQGRALGYVMQSPNQDRVFETKSRLLARIHVAVAGREAERMVFGDAAVTSGAASDIEYATRVAKEMVVSYGMSELGFLRIDPNDPALYDAENPPVRHISKIVLEAQRFVEQRLSANRELLLLLADELRKRETMSGADIMALMPKVEPAENQAA